MTIAENIKKIRIRFDLTQDELGEIAGVSGGAVSTWERGTAEPRMGAIQRIADKLNISKSDIIEDISSMEITPKSVTIPVLNTVVAGMPVDAYEDIIGYEEISRKLANTGEFFALEIKGDSMLPVLQEKDIVIVRQQSDVESGDIAIVLIGGETATVKKVMKQESGITLIGFNPTVYEPHFYSNEEIETLPIKIAGKVVEMKRSF